ncbi:uncharacterized protein EI90DRAFT_3021453 [Cantharellus anzutake]|uniref:uncharacterized protein n=1 Tax=Cantharellus anzutake TaxID=1750568 RepID=UPI0019068454|nr:uncharacterized protein EI90DRAFT_3021453 [Cantharellus anzutake]KAF8316959.1 hypothetical protein EI90DRAFT_3021453 [Cantharellus anzutake]
MYDSYSVPSTYEYTGSREDHPDTIKPAKGPFSSNSHSRHEPYVSMRASNIESNSMIVLFWRDDTSTHTHKTNDPTCQKSREGVLRTITGIERIPECLSAKDVGLPITKFRSDYKRRPNHRSLFASAGEGGDIYMFIGTHAIPRKGRTCQLQPSPPRRAAQGCLITSSSYLTKHDTSTGDGRGSAIIFLANPCAWPNPTWRELKSSETTMEGIFLYIYHTVRQRS